MDEVAEIKNRLEVAEVVGNYLPLKQSGRNLKAPCPFHQEKTASFMVSPERGIYHCFGCNEGGDIFTFVMKMEGLEFREALEKLARQAGVELQARKGDSAEANRRRARHYEAHELAVQYFQQTLVRNPKALEYVVKKRGLTKATVQDFGIGYAPDSWNALTDFLVKRDFTYHELLEAGLAGQKSGRSTIYDLFRGRIMFTISDREGRPVGFTGRVLDDSVPKYLNTPQTPLYDKSQIIYGLHLAKEAIRQADEVVLVEGNMDVVASHQAGVKQVVAASGTALTIDQLRTLSKLTKNIKLSFDADRAGLAATERAIELGQKLGLTLRMVEISGAKDADELIKSQPEAWKKAIDDAKYIIDYLFDRFERDFDLTTAIGKRQYADRLASNLRRLADPVEQGHYVKLLATKLDIDEDAVKAKLAQPDAESTIRGGASGSRARKSASNASTGQAPPIPEPQHETVSRREGQTHLGQMPTHASADTPDYGGGRSMDASTYDTGDDGRWDAIGEPLAEGEASPRARVQVTRKPAMREQLEEAVLALTLTFPLTRLALDDLKPHAFSNERRQAVFAAIKTRGEESGQAIAETLTEQSDYLNILLLRGEQEFADIAPADRSFEAFGLTRRLQILSNTQLKQQLQDQLREAQKSGDVELELRLLGDMQSIIQEEA